MRRENGALSKESGLGSPSLLSGQDPAMAAPLWKEWTRDSLPPSSEVPRSLSIFAWALGSGWKCSDLVLKLESTEVLRVQLYATQISQELGVKTSPEPAMPLCCGASWRQTGGYFCVSPTYSKLLGTWDLIQCTFAQQCNFAMSG